MNEFIKDWGTVIIWTQITLNLIVSFINVRQAIKNRKVIEVYLRLSQAKSSKKARHP